MRGSMMFGGLFSRTWDGPEVSVSLVAAIMHQDSMQWASIVLGHGQFGKLARHTPSHDVCPRRCPLNSEAGLQDLDCTASLSDANWCGRRLRRVVPLLCITDSVAAEGVEACCSAHVERPCALAPMLGQQ